MLLLDRADPLAGPHDDARLDTQRYRPVLVHALVLAAALFNMALCFVSTRGIHLSLVAVAGTEVLIIIAAGAATWRSLLATALPGLLLFGLWLVSLLLINPDITPKIGLDFAIILVFYRLGRDHADPVIGDRLVLALALVVLGVALFEWFFFDLYQQLFNIFQFYVGKGALDISHAGDTGTTLGENGIRPDARQLFPILGLHRAGSVFLEPIALGNFATILIVWVMARARADRLALLLVPVAFVLGVLADDRFAVGAGVAVAIAVGSGLWRYRWPAALLPFAAMAAVMAFAGAVPPRIVDNTVGGRLYGSGSFLLDHGPIEWLGLSPVPVDMDSGYSYLVFSIGLVVPAALWLRYAGSPPATATEARCRLGLATYMALSLLISASFTSIKTAALLWVLAGAATRPGPVDAAS